MFGLSWALGKGRLTSRPVAIGLGVILGLLAGFAMGSWVAALMLVVLIDAVFAVLLILHAREPREGLAAFGGGFHAAALIALLPAVLASPWKEEFPWMVVNLSWFHLAYLAIGTAVFIPLLFLNANARLFRLYPWCVASVLLLIGLGSALIPGGPVDGIAEGFDWVSRQNSFMSLIDESRPLFGAGSVPNGVFTYIGGFIWLLPVAWFAGVLCLWKERRLELLPWVIVLPPIALQAIGQVRFTDALLLPAAVLVSWFVVDQLPWQKLRGPRWLALPLILLVVGASQASTSMRVWDATQGARVDFRKKRASRELCDWIANQGVIQDPSAVLAVWNRGHEIEWAARRPSVATNFGSYVGEVGFLSPARFFLAQDPAAAEAVLEERDADLVLLSVDLSDALPGWIQAGPADWKGQFYSLDANGRGQLRRPWFESVGGQLLNGGFPRVPRGESRANSLGFLRLIHASPTVLSASPISSWKGATPYGWVWERVAGARVQFTGEPNSPVAVEIALEHPTGPNGTPQTTRFIQNAVLNDSGRAELRVPYNTTGMNGEGRVLSALWRIGSTSGPLHIEERQVREGLDVLIKP